MNKKILSVILVAVMLISALSVCASAVDYGWEELGGILKTIVVDDGINLESAKSIANTELGTTSPAEDTQSVIYSCDLDDLYYRIFRGGENEVWTEDAVGYSLEDVNSAISDDEWYVIGSSIRELAIYAVPDRTVATFETVDAKFEDVEVVSGMEPFSYTWFADDVEIPGSNNKGYTVTNPTLAMDGTVYYCSVGDAIDHHVETGRYTLKVLPDKDTNWNELNKDVVSITLDEGIDELLAMAVANKKLGNANASGSRETVIYANGDGGYSTITRAKDEYGWNADTYADLNSAIAALSGGKVYVIGTMAYAELKIVEPTKAETKKIDYKTGVGTVKLTVSGGRAPYTFALEGMYAGGDWEPIANKTTDSDTYSMNVKNLLLSDNDMQLCISATDANGDTVSGPITTVEVVVPKSITGNYFKPGAPTEDCVLTIGKKDQPITKDDLISVSFAGKDVTEDLKANKNGSIKNGANGTLLITLDKAYLKTLKLGNYKLTVKLGDYINPVEITENVTVSNVPKTSDNTHIVLLSTLLAAFALTAVVADRKRKVN